MVDDWRSEAGLSEEHSTSVHWGSNSFWHVKSAEMSLALNEPRLLYIQIQILPPSMQHKGKEIINIVCKTTTGKSQETNSPRKAHWVRDNSIILQHIGGNKILPPIPWQAPEAEALCLSMSTCPLSFQHSKLIGRTQFFQLLSTLENLFAASSSEKFPYFPVLNASDFEANCCHELTLLIVLRTYTRHYQNPSPRSMKTLIHFQIQPDLMLVMCPFHS